MGITGGINDVPLPGTQANAPWILNAETAELARAIETRMREIGVSADRCSVGVGNANEVAAASQAWFSFESERWMFMMTSPSYQRASEFYASGAKV